MKIDTSTKEGRKLALIYEVVKNGIPEDFEPFNSNEDILPYYREAAYEQGKHQAYWDIKELIEAPEFESKKIKEV